MSLRANYPMSFVRPAAPSGWRHWLSARSREQRLVAGGLLLALVLLLLLCRVLSGNLAQARSQQLAREQLIHERQRCSALTHWRERAQCLHRLNETRPAG